VELNELIRFKRKSEIQERILNNPTEMVKESI
jgi:hypothetical protein